eukprot:3844273-Amphidinium_carterae.1
MLEPPIRATCKMVAASPAALQVEATLTIMRLERHWADFVYFARTKKTNMSGTSTAFEPNCRALLQAFKKATLRYHLGKQEAATSSVSSSVRASCCELTTPGTIKEQKIYELFSASPKAVYLGVSQDPNCPPTRTQPC